MTTEYAQALTEWYEDVEYVGVPFENRTVPFSSTDPILFHVLTTLRSGELGEKRLEQLMLEDACIAPPDEVEDQSWGALSAQALMMPRDIVAGDSQYFFMTPLRPFHHSVAATSDVRNHPAVAYYASTIESLDIPYFFRVADLEWAYTLETSMVNMEAFCMDIENGLIDPMDEDQWAAEAAYEELQAIADCGTQYDATKSRKLLQLYAAAAGAKDHRKAQVDEAIAIANKYDLYPTCDAHEYTAVLDDTSDAIHQMWRMLLNRFAHYNIQESIFHREPPEILVPTPLPLRKADFVRDGSGQWHRIAT